MTTYYTRMDSPIGSLLLAGDGKRLHMLRFPEGRRPQEIKPGWVEDSGKFKEEINQLHAYFAGESKQFDLSLAPQGTEFQRKVWSALQSIPYGETRSYGELASQVGNGRASRAVGAANGQNPIPVIIPCHRVIGSDGSLTGFGGGLETKQQLLALEQNHSAAS